MAWIWKRVWRDLALQYVCGSKERTIQSSGLYSGVCIGEKKQWGKRKENSHWNKENAWNIGKEERKGLTVWGLNRLGRGSENGKRAFSGSFEWNIWWRCVVNVMLLKVYEKTNKYSLMRDERGYAHNGIVILIFRLFNIMKTMISIKISYLNYGFKWFFPKIEKE